jgi:hypothetical protein
MIVRTNTMTSLNEIRRLVFIMVAGFVFCGKETDFVYAVLVIASLQRVNIANVLVCLLL